MKPTTYLPPGSSLMDFAVRQYGTPAGLWLVWDANPEAAPRTAEAAYSVAAGSALLVPKAPPSVPVTPAPAQPAAAAQPTYLRPGQTPMDAAVAAYGTATGMWLLWDANPAFAPADPQAPYAPAAGLLLMLPPTPPAVPVPPVPAAVAHAPYVQRVVERGQSVIDRALLDFGTPAGFWQLVADNVLLPAFTAPAPGQTVRVWDATLSDAPLVVARTSDQGRHSAIRERLAREATRIATLDAPLPVDLLLRRAFSTGFSLGYS